MKKSFLGLTFAALTILGCQNYDDQFDDLNSKIAALSGEISTLSGISAAVADLTAKVSALDSATAQELTAILTEVSGLQAQLADIDNINAQVDDLEQEIDDIMAMLNELLEQAAVINQDIVITSAAQLDYVESLMAIDPNDDIDDTFDADTTRQYILSGNLTIDAEFAATSSDTSLATRLDNVIDRFATVIAPDGGSGVTIDSGTAASSSLALTLDALSFVQGDVHISGFGSIGLDALAAISSTNTFTIALGGATALDIEYPSLNQVGDVIIAATATISSLNFSQIATGGTISTDAAGTELSDPALAGVVNLGKLDLPAQVSLAKATEIHAGGAPNGVEISAPLATQVVLMDTTPFAATGATVSITAKGDIHVNLTGASTITINSTTGGVQLASLTGTGSQTSITASTSVNLGAVTSNAGGLLVSGTDINLGALKSNAGQATLTANTVNLDLLESNAGGLNIGGTIKALTLPKLKTSAASLTTVAATLDAGVLVTGTATANINVGSGATLHLGSLGSPSVLAGTDWANVKILQLNQQASNLDFSGAVSLTTLRYTGKKITPVAEGSQSNVVTITGANTKLKTVSFPDYEGTANHLGTLTVTGTAIGSLTTGGVILNTNIINNNALTTFTVDHAHLNGELATTITVSGNASLTSLDLSSMNKVKAISVTGNGKIASITAPALTQLAEPVADIDVEVSGNALVGAYTAAVSGTETSPYAKAKVHYNASVASLLGFLAKYEAQTRPAGVSTITYNIDIDKTTPYTQSYDAATQTWSEKAGTATPTALSAQMDADVASQQGSDNTHGTADDNSDNNTNSGSGISSAEEVAATVTTTT